MHSKPFSEDNINKENIESKKVRKESIKDIVKESREQLQLKKKSNQDTVNDIKKSNEKYNEKISNNQDKYAENDTDV